jgi:preprotein translocase subunit SecG
VSFVLTLLNIVSVVTAFFLICLILIQRGKGGGLAGAFGGAGGSSAFGTKAGDVFTRVTIVTAGIWIVINMGLVILNNQSRPSAFALVGAGSSEREVPVSGEGSRSKSVAPAAPAPAKTADPAKTGATAKPSTAKETDSSLPPVFDDSATPPAKSSPKAAEPDSKKAR